ncbi:MAG: tetratricopeptide repeat protein, partial [Candidatus Obscuribacterales bacterium]|nr:tetratricopeptide repeat protein [Candidatus Obscuribacterales bacterium]
HFFDSECNIAAPTSFSVDGNQFGSPALSEFLNRAVDFESAFEYAAEANSAQTTETELPSKYKTELNEEESGSFCAQPNTEEASKSTETQSYDKSSRESCRIIDQAAVLKDPQESSISGAPVEFDEMGRVCKALFGSGEAVCFNYDESGELCEFNYAGIQWKKEAECWVANDRQTDYLVDGKISVLENGSIRIEREDVVRILKLSGTRIDEHKSGSRTESRKLKNKPSPYDLLAKAKAVNSLWLSSRQTIRHGEHAAQPAPLKLDLLDQQKTKLSSPNSMIPSIAEVQTPGTTGANLTCVPSAPIELRSMERSDKLRELEDQLLEAEEKQATVGNTKLRILESWLKSSLWITDRVVGQSSPKHLVQLDQLADLYFEQQRNDLAELTHLRALHIREQFYGKGQPELAISVSGLAKIYEARGNYIRAEEMYKEAISLQESGLRKILFLYSEKVIDSSKLTKQIDAIFASITDLSRMYAKLGKASQCAVVCEKAIGLSAEIAEREPAVAENELKGCIEKHIDEMRLLSI